MTGAARSDEALVAEIRTAYANAADGWATGPAAIYRRLARALVGWLMWLSAPPSGQVAGRRHRDPRAKSLGGQRICLVSELGVPAFLSDPGRLPARELSRPVAKDAEI
jgi:hypothetical protein